MADDEMVAWLSATLDKLAFEAEEAADAGGYEWDSFAAEPGYGAYVHAHGKSLTQGGIVEASGPLAVDHIALHDPRAVLARADAERSAVRVFRDHAQWSDDPSNPDPETYRRLAGATLDVLRWLAYGHRFDASGYRTEWSPE